MLGVLNSFIIVHCVKKIWFEVVRIVYFLSHVLVNIGFNYWWLVTTF